MLPVEPHPQVITAAAEATPAHRVVPSRRTKALVQRVAATTNRKNPRATEKAIASGETGSEFSRRASEMLVLRRENLFCLQVRLRFALPIDAGEHQTLGCRH